MCGMGIVSGVLDVLGGKGGSNIREVGKGHAVSSGVLNGSCPLYVRAVLGDEQSAVCSCVVGMLYRGVVYMVCMVFTCHVGGWKILYGI